MDYKEDVLVFENAEIMFRNFSGKERTRFDKLGDRKFCVVIPDYDTAQKLLDDKWNVKVLPPRNEDEKPKYFIEVAVGYKYKPPKVYLHSGKKVTELDEDTIGELDDADIKSVDLSVRAHEWEVNGKTGIKGYLKNMHVVLEADEFAEKYAVDEEDDILDEIPFR